MSKDNDNIPDTTNGRGPNEGESQHTNETQTKDSDIVENLRQILGESAVLIPIPKGQKGPKTPGWQNTPLDVMRDPAYLEQLRQGNIGVLLGTPSGGLCAIDIDRDEAVEPFLELNPKLRESFRTRGKRGVQIWIRIPGVCPKLTKIKESDGSEWGEWRADGGQSVVYGIHPEGMPYKRAVDSEPVEIEFDEIKWPVGLVLPCVPKEAYDQLVEEEGQPFTVSERGSVTLNQMFFVRKYLVEHLVIFDSGLGEFFEYESSEGLWKRQTIDSIKRRFCEDLRQAARLTGHYTIYHKRTDSMFNGLVALLRSQAERRNAFSARPKAIHVRNGMIVFEDGRVELKGFHPDYLSRNMCPYEIDMKAECPRFLNDLLGVALGKDDIRLLQKWAGSVLLGQNQPQRLLLLMGTPNGGKSTVMTILERIIGQENIAQLRTEHLTDRFELFGYVGKTLLTGKDVSANFLMTKGAHVIKALVGGDLLDAEKKGFNERVQLRGDFNVGITCNADLNIRLEGDEGAWRRRLLPIKYERNAPSKRIPDFADVLLKEEGAGILRWMVEGAIALLSDLEECGDYVLTSEQKLRIDNLMNQSESVKRFVAEGVQRDAEGKIGSVELLGAYHGFCDRMGWAPLPDSDVRKELPKRMAEIHRVHERHDMKEGITCVRGYKRVALVKGGKNNED